MLKIEVVRQDNSKRDVTIMLDRHTNKYCYDNLTTIHVCPCRFDNEMEALYDLMKDDNVKEFKVIK